MLERERFSRGYRAIKKLKGGMQERRPFVNFYEINNISLQLCFFTQF